MNFISIVPRILLFALLWIALGGNVTEDPAIVALSVGAATAASAMLWPPRGRVSPLAVVRFVPYFLARSLAGASDVARRAFAPRMRIRPELRRIPLRLRSTRARVVFSWIVSLCPGTASVSLDEETLVIHVLDHALFHEDALRGLEQRVAEIFRERMEP
jgi:multicomponent Na+:H+ antiporter subunit E